MNNWKTKPLDLLDPAGKGTSERNFHNEHKDFPSIFTREALQNTLDARHDLTIPARIRIHIVGPDDGLDSDYLSKITDDLEPHVYAAGLFTEKDFKELPSRALIYEEFNTVGLSGKTDKSHAKGEDERWANFWHGEGKRSKSGKSLGRAGEGKITYHQASQIRTLLAWSIRGYDPKECLYGKCIFKEDYEFGGNNYGRHAHWCTIDGDNPQPLPCTKPEELQRFKSAFCLSRKPSENGTSFVIPYHRESLNKESLIEAMVSEFFYTILSGELIVDICGETIDADTIERHLPRDGSPNKVFFNFVEAITQSGETLDATINSDWQESNSIDDAMFFPKELEPLKEKFEAGKIVGVKMPVTVYPKKVKPKDSYIKVFLQCNDDLIQETEELFTRSGLSIGDEKKLKNSPGKVLGLCIGEDEMIADFLGHAEEASHLKWNAQDPEVNERYDKVSTTLSHVRQGPVRLFKFLKGMNKGLQEDKFLDILSIPGAQKKTKKKPKKKEGKTPPPPPPPPPPSKTVFQTKDSKAGTISICKGEDPLENFPVTGKMTLAYARMTGDGDPFSKYHHYDFDLASSGITVKVKNMNITSKELNVIEFEITGPDFEMNIFGFSESQRLRARTILDY
jgi:hypothetical protein